MSKVSIYCFLLILLAIPVHAAEPTLIYEIFTRSFKDSNGDGMGDLEGVRSKLDYISSLGADAIWLTPIYESPSYHGYDVSDYRKVKSEYGDLDALHHLISDAHQRGIQVLLDIPVNHTSLKHEWFKSPSRKEDFYLWSPEPLHWTQINLSSGEKPEDHWHLLNGSNQYYFTSFSSRMPDLNWRNPEVLQEITDIFKFWQAQGVDGFRLDAAKFLVKGPNGEQNTPETHQIWKQIAASLKESAGNSFLIGEVWDSAANIASYYGNGDELNAAFDFPAAQGIRSSLVTGKSTRLSGALGKQLRVLQKKVAFAGPFVGNHDMSRLATIVKGDLKKEKLAAVALFSLPGPITIYYGDEIGLPDGTGKNDLEKRTPMIWSEDAGRGFTDPTTVPWESFSTADRGISVDAQENDSESLLNEYRRLAKIHRENPPLREGELTSVKNIGVSALSYTRILGDAQTVVVLNFGPKALGDQEIVLSSESKGFSQPKVLFGNAQASWVEGKEGSRIKLSGLDAESGVMISVGVEP